MIRYFAFAGLCFRALATEGSLATLFVDQAAAAAVGEALLQTSKQRREALSKDVHAPNLAPLKDQNQLEICYGSEGYQGAPECVPVEKEAEHRMHMGLALLDFNQTMVGEDAPLTAEGFKDVTSVCCPVDTEAFFNRLLASMGMAVCSKAHVQGLMHWFTCVPGMDFQLVLDVIENGNPCKYWAPVGEDCPELSAECQGKHCGAPLPVTEAEDPLAPPAPAPIAVVPGKPATATAPFPLIPGRPADAPVAGGFEPVVPTTTPEPTTTVTTVPTKCQGDVEFKYWNSELYHSNLNNLGPHSNGSEGVHISSLGEFDGQSFDLLIESISDRYSSKWARYNGVYGYYGYLTMNMGSAMDLRFTVMKAGTREPLVLPKFYFSLFDLDTANPDVSDYPKKGAEVVTVGGSFLAYHTGPNTELEIFNTTDGKTVFRAQVFGTSKDNPRDPNNMTLLQQNRAVAFEFVNTSTWTVTYEVLDGGLSRGREVYFAGRSQLAMLPCQGE